MKSTVAKFAASVETTAEVICVRREGAYLRFPQWCSATALLLPRDRVLKHVPLPALGTVYAVQADLSQLPPTLTAFQTKFLREVPVSGPQPLAPPAGLPGPGEGMPIFSESALRRLIQSTICERLSKESLDALAYLVRRAHGLGSLGR